jgi:pyruvate carboxylase subunit B
MRYFVTVAGRTIEVDLSGHTPVVDGQPIESDLARVPGTPSVSLLADGRSYALTARAGAGGTWDLTIGTQRLRAEVVDERTRAIREMTGGGAAAEEKEVKAPMPGLVVRVEVEPGQPVRAGQGVVIVEAMKMENELKAPADGVVASIAVAAGQPVEKGHVLLVLE